MKFFFLALLFTFFSINKAYAYLDPGTGSIILQAIIGFIAFVGIYLKILKNKIKYFLKKFFYNKKKY